MPNKIFMIIAPAYLNPFDGHSTPWISLYAYKNPCTRTHTKRQPYWRLNKAKAGISAVCVLCVLLTCVDFFLAYHTQTHSPEVVWWWWWWNSVHKPFLFLCSVHFCWFCRAQRTCCCSSLVNGAFVSTTEQCSQMYVNNRRTCFDTLSSELFFSDVVGSTHYENYTSKRVWARMHTLDIPSHRSAPEQINFCAEFDAIQLRYLKFWLLYCKTNISIGSKH